MGFTTDNLLLLTVSITITLIIIYYYYQDIYYYYSVVNTIAERQLKKMYGSMNPRIANKLSLCSTTYICTPFEDLR